MFGAAQRQLTARSDAPIKLSNIFIFISFLFDMGRLLKLLKVIDKAIFQVKQFIKCILAAPTGSSTRAITSAPALLF